METPYLDNEINLLKSIEQRHHILSDHGRGKLIELEHVKKVYLESFKQNKSSEKENLIGYLNIIESCYDIEFGDLEKTANYILSKD